MSNSKSVESITYESTRARQSTELQPDKIHYDGSASFRDAPYRQLHHQRGKSGIFRIRLLEAAGLQRSYWSVLALGPVKHLGLSVAHGDVSACCTFSLKYKSKHEEQETLDRKPAAVQTQNPTIVSPTVPNNNNPVWDNCQFECPLIKGAAGGDGKRIILTVRVDEEATAVENIIPGIPSAGARMLGTGELDLTDLCLGESDDHALPGVKDAWLPISLPAQHQEQMKEKLSHASDMHQKLHDQVARAPITTSTGRVRVLVSYEPVGLEPQARDVVALESFARRNLATATCRPVLPPLHPLMVRERRGSFLLCEYALPDQRRACIRLHRNSVFVIERQNLKDAAHNMVLLPVDVVLSTPVGKAAARALGPVTAAGRELMMPAVLSFKLVWMAAKTTTLAGLSGVQALGSTFWQVGSSSLTATHRRDSRQDGLAQFVQL